MSRSMPRVKSRWKGAALVAAAAAIVPALAHAAPSLTVDLKLAPLGSAAPKSTIYITPQTTSVPVYVYATIDTGGAALSASQVAGLEYLYYNVNAATTGTAKIAGGVTAALNTPFTSNGSQVGVNSAVTAGTTSNTVLGGTDLTNVAKPRNSNVSWSTGAADGTNLVVNGSKVSFLVETLTFTPSGFTASTPGALNTTTFSPVTPTVDALYQSSNYFAGLTSTPTPGTSIGAANTFSGVTAGSSVTIIDTLNGDANADGRVNSGDLAIVAGNFNKLVTPGYATGDFDSSGRVNSGDLAAISSNFNKSLGAVPSAQVAAAAVPEPTSLGLLVVGGLALASRRRRA